MADYLKDLVVRDCSGQDYYMHELLKTVTLIVNVDCKVGGESNNECPGLEALYLKYKDRGFEILAFPCDQFQIGSRAHCTAMEVKEDLAKRYHVTFPIMHKVNVNGETAHPLFIYLQKRLSGFPNDAIKWDFTKFLIVDGEPKKRYAPTVSPQSIELEIAHHLSAPSEGTQMHISSPIDTGSNVKSFTNQPWQQGYIPSQQEAVTQRQDIGSGQGLYQSSGVGQQGYQPTEQRGYQDIGSRQQEIWLGGGVSESHPAYGGPLQPKQEQGQTFLGKLSQGMQEMGLGGSGTSEQRQEQSWQREQSLGQQRGDIGIQKESKMWLGAGVGSSHSAYGGAGDNNWEGRGQGQSWQREQGSQPQLSEGRFQGQDIASQRGFEQESLGSGLGSGLERGFEGEKHDVGLGSRKPQESWLGGQQQQERGMGGQERYVDSQQRTQESLGQQSGLGGNDFQRQQQGSDIGSQKREGEGVSGQQWVGGGVSSGQPGFTSGIAPGQYIGGQQGGNVGSSPYGGSDKSGMQGHDMGQGVGQGTYGLRTPESKVQDSQRTGLMAGPSYGADSSPTPILGSDKQQQQGWYGSEPGRQGSSQVEVPPPAKVSDLVQGIEHGQSIDPTNEHLMGRDTARS